MLAAPDAASKLVQLADAEPVGVDNPVLFQLLQPGLFDGWFDAMREAAANWDGSEPIRDARPLMAAAMAESLV